VLQSAPAQPSTAAQPGAVITPPPGAVGAVGQPAGGPALPPEELADLKAMFDALSPDEKLEMKAAYAGMGVDLDLLFGADANAPSQLVDAVKVLDFGRNPKAVLAARSQLGFGRVARPDPRTAKPADLAKWLHLHVMAGEWETFAQFSPIVRPPKPRRSTPTSSNP
jgi:hypothetical protein